MKCPYCGARATHNGDAYHCGTDVDGRQSKQCEKDSGHVAPFRYIPPEADESGDSNLHRKLVQELQGHLETIRGSVGVSTQLLNDVLKCKGKVPNALRARIKKFLGDE